MYATNQRTELATLARTNFCGLLSNGAFLTSHLEG